MSVRVRVLPETDPQAQRSQARHWLTTTVTTAAVAVAGTTIITANDPDASRPPSDNQQSSRLTDPTPANYRCDNWKFNDPQVRKGAGGAPIRSAQQGERTEGT